MAAVPFSKEVFAAVAVHLHQVAELVGIDAGAVEETESFRSR